MRFKNTHELRKFLAREVLGKDIPRKPPQSARKGPPRDEEYLTWIRTLPCCACGSRRNVEAAHTGSDGGTSQKASDYSCVPLCAWCHRLASYAYHQTCRRDFERLFRLDFAELAGRLVARWRAERVYRRA